MILLTVESITFLDGMILNDFFHEPHMLILNRFLVLLPPCVCALTAQPGDADPPTEICGSECQSMAEELRDPFGLSCATYLWLIHT